jgi:hypothetical protein
VHGLNILASKNGVVVDLVLLDTNVRLSVGIELGSLVCEVEVDRVRPRESNYDWSALLIHFTNFRGNLQKMRGMHMACLVPILSATLPRMTGMTAPPQTEETRKDAPRLVWRPRPRRVRAKIL